MNKIILKGRICQDLDLNVTQSGTEMLNFSVAVPRTYDREQTDFINCQAWKKTAVFISTYFEKGREILLEGELRQDNWEDKNGNKRTTYKVNVGNVEFCGSKGSGGKSSDDELPFSPDEDAPW
ncbi:MAG: single-stranded DNA-binding protein [Bacillota bacterium]|jgi:single-strand DNA-binding protein